MGLNAELTAILRDVVQFLEFLREVKLPTRLENIRDNLLIRSKDTLTMFVIERIGRSASPEPYLNMNAAGSKGLMVTLKTETELQEYVGAEEHPQKQQQQQDYYEAFQGMESTNNTATAIHETINNRQTKEEEIENTLVNIYANFSATETKSKCQLCGLLYRKEGKKLFVFEQYRSCWVGLVGLHLLIYGSDRDNRPCTILPIHGYMARAAPNAIPRDQRRSESTFEIFRPGCRTFQFSAKNPKDMEQWITKICELGSEKKIESKELTREVDNIVANNIIKQSNDSIQEDLNCKEERYQDVSSLSINEPSDKSSIIPPVANKETEREANDSSTKDSFHVSTDSSLPQFSNISDTVTSSRLHSTSPPPLPARIPRKLLTVSVRNSSYEFPDEEEDDIYHKIEEVRDTTQYGNVGDTFQSQIKINDEQSNKKSTTYDDVRASIKSGHKFDDKRKKKETNRKSIASRNELTYDDTANTMSEDNKVVDEQNKFVSYDNVENIVLNTKSIKAQTMNKTDEPSKSPQKKSFLNRMRSKKDFPRKNEKKTKCKTSPQLLPSVNNQELSTYYDDISDLMNIQQETIRVEEQQSEYTCPPPPRPIYAKPPIINDVIDTDQFYDDVAYRDKSKNYKLPQQTTKNLSPDFVRTNINRPVLCENINYSQGSSLVDNEHYKIPPPRSELCYPKSLSINQQVDDLYDDIAILADFTARQKEVLNNRDHENLIRSQSSPEKKSWNRFVTGKKSKMIDSTVIETNGRVLTELEDSSDDCGEQHTSLRMNTFQKLISRMENSLSKTSAKSADRKSVV